MGDCLNEEDKDGAHVEHGCHCAHGNVVDAVQHEGGGSGSQAPPYYNRPKGCIIPVVLCWGRT